MSKKINEKLVNTNDAESSYPVVENETSDNSDKKKKPLLERLGLIEPITKSLGSNNVDEIESELSTTFDSRSTNTNNENVDVSDREEKHAFEKLSVNEIYEQFGLDATENNTVYLIENFIKALPANLPAEVKRQSIINLISVSQVDIICLLNDGTKRLELLKKYYQDFSVNVDDIIASNEKQIRKLNERIAYHNKIINEKQNMQEEQKAIIEFEVQKLTNIIEFIENKTKQ